MPNQKPIKIDLTDTENIKNILIKADKENRQYMILSNLEVWENIEILVQSILASMTYLVSIGEDKQEVFEKILKFFEDGSIIKVEKKENEIPKPTTN